jgi:trimeric autotransporter adhesin
MLKTKIGAAIATTALLLSTVTPAFATTNLTVSGNGADSTSNVTTNSTTANSVVQSNNASITNTVTTNVDTGMNNANKNTGGNTTIDTGNAAAIVSVSNAANLNKAVTSDCNCTTGDKNLTIKDNGADTTNSIDTTSASTNSVFQNNAATFTNNVTTDLQTGKNNANENTGGTSGGGVSVLTGSAVADVAVANQANKNLALLGALGSGSLGSTNLTIAGNGADSSNDITTRATRANAIVQANDASFRNNILTDVGTGKNNANENTGGGVLVDTGMAKALVSLTNDANFNAAAVNDCGCFVNLNAKVGDNGADTTNSIDTTSTNALQLFQGGEGNGNNARFSNTLAVEPTSGTNQANENTATLAGDPTVLTGNAGSSTTVVNQANANVYGSIPDVSVGFDVGAVLSSLGM